MMIFRRLALSVGLAVAISMAPGATAHAAVTRPAPPDATDSTTVTATALRILLQRARDLPQPLGPADVAYLGWLMECLVADLSAGGDGHGCSHNGTATDGALPPGR